MLNQIYIHYINTLFVLESFIISCWLLKGKKIGIGIGIGQFARKKSVSESATKNHDRCITNLNHWLYLLLCFLNFRWGRSGVKHTRCVNSPASCGHCWQEFDSSICVCVCVCVCVCITIYIYIYIYIYTHTYIYTCIYTYTYIRIWGILEYVKLNLLTENKECQYNNSPYTKIYCQAYLDQ